MEHDDWLLTSERVAVHLPTATAVLADLHLGYHAARRRRGDAVPLPALAETLDPLADVLTRFALRRVVIAGDLFEDGVDEAIAAELLEWFADHDAELTAVVPGNHDRLMSRPGVCGPNFNVVAEGFSLGKWRIVHGDQELPVGPVVCGHWHPAIRVSGRLEACYVIAKDRLILPAFCREARGVDIHRLRLEGQPQAVSALFTSSEPATNRGRSRSGRTTSGRPSI
jgi:putative SbcD/Mre11-related phosphoesterase